MGWNFIDFSSIFGSKMGGKTGQDSMQNFDQNLRFSKIGIFLDLGCKKGVRGRRSVAEPLMFGLEGEGRG